MTKYILNRPIAVFMVTLALIIFSLLALNKLPVSLLPKIDVPTVIIKVNFPGGAPKVLEENILKPIRENLSTLSGLESVESIASGETGQLVLQFSYATDMDLMYIEINERLDRIQNLLPEGLARPKVLRIGINDIPIIRLQVVPKTTGDIAKISELSRKVIRRRIEQIEGVSLVEIFGSQDFGISISPNFETLHAYGLTLSDLTSTIKNNNIEWGSISIKDGQYRYYLKMASIISTPEEILKLPIITKDNMIVRVSDVAKVETIVKPARDYHLHRQDRAISIMIHKQNDARMLQVIDEVKKTINVFEKDYPEANFFLTQDQSNLLEVGINNLLMALLLGGAFAFAILFAFMSNIRIAIIIGISLPLSLLLSFLILYMLGISINIISLSGLALGLGMLIDNSIVVLDNISSNRDLDYSLADSCIRGVNEVTSPLISSALTTVAVFVPLVFLHGMSGVLFYEQAVSVTSILGISLLVAFIVLPLLYRGAFSKSNSFNNNSKIFDVALAIYNTVFKAIWNYKLSTLGIITLICLIGFWLGFKSGKSELPKISRHEALLRIDWNEPIGVDENEQRIRALLYEFNNATISTESEIGRIGSSIAESEYGYDKAEVYFFLNEKMTDEKFKTELINWFNKNYSNAIISIMSAPNVFDQLFINTKPFLRIKFRELDKAYNKERIKNILNDIGNEYTFDEGYSNETYVKVLIDHEKLALYDISLDELQEHLLSIFSTTEITKLNQFGSDISVILLPYPRAQYELNNIYISSFKEIKYPLSAFLTLDFVEDSRYITADIKGSYKSISIENTSQIESKLHNLKNKALTENIIIDLDGNYFDSLNNIKHLIFILIVSIALLYFILASQFESFLQPLVIILTLPLGIGGSLILLYSAGLTLNIMSIIGIIIMMGIMINDAILKVDKINREIALIGTNMLSKESISLAIHRAGISRLRPILMTSLTTILALTPILFVAGLGADLQKGLAIAVIGGLSVGTITSLFFVPITYYYVKIFRLI